MRTPPEAPRAPDDASSIRTYLPSLPESVVHADPHDMAVVAELGIVAGAGPAAAGDDGDVQGFLAQVVVEVLGLDADVAAERIFPPAPGGVAGLDLAAVAVELHHPA